MKKYSSIRKGNSPRAYLPRSVRIAVLCALVACLLVFVVPTIARAVVAVVMYPIEATRVWLAESSSSLPQYLRERETLVAELEALKLERALTQATDRTIIKLQEENDEFRRLHGAIPDERVVARVIGRPDQLPYDRLMIDRGKAEGVVLDAPVFQGIDQIIGYVAAVYEHSALVTLVTTANFKTTAYVIGPDIYTFTEGMGGGVLRVRVPQGVPLAVGDTVILPAIDSGVYGEIVEVVSSPTQPEQYGYVPLTVPLQSLQYVSVGRQPIVPFSYEVAKDQVDTLKSELFTIDLPPGVLVTPEVSTSTATTSLSTGATTSTTTRPRE
jgi:cell shape-determining protein MreC